LRRRGAPDGLAQTIVADLEARGYVDDAGFARFWAEARARGRSVGSIRLRRELAAKGIPPHLVTAAVEAAFAERGEGERAREAAERRLPALRRYRSERLAPRLRDYLLRRGYPPVIVERIVSDVVGDAGPDSPPAA
jgi:regulatory protein